ncbi:hypothetical protein CR513_44195, partial [Mucuna pruriens]
MGNARFLKEVEFGKEENIRNVEFEEEYVNDIFQVLVPITIQETTTVIEENVQIIVLNNVLEQDYDEVLFQISIEQSQQPRKVPLRRSIRERRHAILDDYIVFLQEYEDDIGLIEDDPINFCQVMQKIHEMDVKIMFLNGDIDKTIYMVQPENFVSNDSKSMISFSRYLTDPEMQHWKAVKRTLIAPSTMAAKFVAYFEASNHGIWLRNFVTSLWVVDGIERPLKIIVTTIQQSSTPITIEKRETKVPRRTQDRNMRNIRVGKLKHFYLHSTLVGLWSSRLVGSTQLTTQVAIAPSRPLRSRQYKLHLRLVVGTA